MKTLIAILLLTIMTTGFAQTPVSHIETTKQTITYDTNGPYGRQLISVERQTVRDGYKDESGFHQTGKRERSVATMIPLDK